MIHKVELSSKRGPVDVHSMEIGDIAYIEEAGYEPEVVGEYIMKTYSEFVLLTNPQTTWDSKVSFNGYKVRILPKGTKITLTIGG